MDHDRLFKELIATFFLEFIDLFLPGVSAYLDKSAEVIPLDKEVFTDVTAGKKHLADLVMKVKFRGEDAFFLIHVENQARQQADFPRRMFGYFARLHEKYEIPIYPVVIFSYDKPLDDAPSRYEVAFPDRTVLQFDFKVIQLNRLPWHDFVHQTNPVASALMAKMQMAPEDRPKVKVECLRLLASLRLDPARSKLIGGFIDSYLKLTAKETKIYERELASLAPDEREATVELMTSWEATGWEKGVKEGLQQGLHDGKAQILAQILKQRLGSMPVQAIERIRRLTEAQMDELTTSLPTINEVADLEAWLSHKLSE